MSSPWCLKMFQIQTAGATLASQNVLFYMPSLLHSALSLCGKYHVRTDALYCSNLDCRCIAVSNSSVSISDNSTPIPLQQTSVVELYSSGRCVSRTGMQGGKGLWGTKGRRQKALHLSQLHRWCGRWDGSGRQTDKEG